MPECLRLLARSSGLALSGCVSVGRLCVGAGAKASAVRLFTQALLGCNSFTYTGSGGGAWAQTCYLRLDFGFISTVVPASLTVTSGRRCTRFSRLFEHARVDVDLISGYPAQLYFFGNED